MASGGRARRASCAESCKGCRRCEACDAAGFLPALREGAAFRLSITRAADGPAECKWIPRGESLGSVPRASSNADGPAPSLSRSAWEPGVSNSAESLARRLALTAATTLAAEAMQARRRASSTPTQPGARRERRFEQNAGKAQSEERLSMTPVVEGIAKKCEGMREESVAFRENADFYRAQLHRMERELLYKRAELREKDGMVRVLQDQLTSVKLHVETLEARLRSSESCGSASRTESTKTDGLAETHTRAESLETESQVSLHSAAKLREAALYEENSMRREELRALFLRLASQQSRSPELAESWESTALSEDGDWQEEDAQKLLSRLRKERALCLSEKRELEIRQSRLQRLEAQIEGLQAELLSPLVKTRPPLSPRFADELKRVLSESRRRAAAVADAQRFASLRREALQLQETLQQQGESLLLPSASTPAQTGLLKKAFAFIRKVAADRGGLPEEQSASEQTSAALAEERPGLSSAREGIACAQMSAPAQASSEDCRSHSSTDEECAALEAEALAALRRADEVASAVMNGVAEERSCRRPASGGQVKESESLEPLLQELQEAKAEALSLRGEVRALQTREEAMRSDAKKVERHMVRLMSQFRLLESNLAHSEAERRLLEETQRVATKRVEALKKEKANLESFRVSLEYWKTRVEQSEQDVELLTKDKAQLEEELLELRAQGETAGQELERQSEALRRAESEARKRRKDVDQLREKLNAAERSLTQKNAELEALQSATRSAVEKKVACRDVSTNTDDTPTTAPSEGDFSKERFLEQRAMIQLHLEEIEEQREEINRQREISNEQHARLKELAERLSAREAALEAATAREEDLQGRLEEVTCQLRAIERVAQEVAAPREGEDEVHAERLRLLQGQQEALQKQLDESVEAHKLLHKEFERQKAALEAKTLELKEQRRLLVEAQLSAEDLQVALERQTLSEKALQEECDELKVQLSDVKENEAAIAAEAADKQRQLEEEVKILQSQLDALGPGFGSSQTEEETAENATRLKELQREVGELCVERDSLRDLLHSEREEIMRLKDELSSLDKKRRAELRDAQRLLDEALTTNAASALPLQNKLRETEAEVSRLRADLQAARSAPELQKTVDEKTASAANVSSQEVHEEATQQLEVQLRENRRLRRELETQTAEKEDLKKRLEAARASLDAERSALSAKTKDLLSAVRRGAEAEEALRMAQSQIESREELLRNAQRAGAEAQSRVAALEREVLQSRSEAAELRRQFTKQQSEEQETREARRREDALALAEAKAQLESERQSRLRLQHLLNETLADASARTQELEKERAEREELLAESRSASQARETLASETEALRDQLQKRDDTIKAISEILQKTQEQAAREEQEGARLEEAVRSRELELQQLQQALSLSEEKWQEAVAAREDAESRFEAAAAEMEQRQRDIHNENFRLRAQLDALANETNSQQRDSQLKIVALEQRLQEARESLLQEKENLDATQTRLRAETELAESLKVQIENGAEEARRMQARLTEAENESRELQTRLQDAEKRRTLECEKLNEALRAANEREDLTRLRLEGEQKTNADLNAQLTKTQSQLAETQRLHREEENRRTELEKQLADQRRLTETQVSLLEEHRSDQEALLDRCQLQGSQLQEMRRQLEGQLSSVRKEASAQLESQQASLEHLRASLTRERQVGEERLRQLAAQREFADRLEADLAEARRRLEEIPALSAARDELERSLKALKKELENTQGDLQTAEDKLQRERDSRAQEVGELNVANEQQSRELAALSDKLDAALGKLTAEQAAQEELLEKLKVSEAEREKARRAAAQAQAAASAATERIEKLSERLSAELAQVEELRSSANAAQLRQAELEGRLEDLQAKAAQEQRASKARLAEAEGSLKAAREREAQQSELAASRLKECRELRKQMAEQRTSFEKTVDEARQVSKRNQQALSETQADAARKAAVCEDLQRLVDDGAAERKLLTDQKEQLRRQCEDLQEQLTQLTAQWESLQRSREEEREAFKSLEAKHADATASLRDFEKRAATLEAQLSDERQQSNANQKALDAAEQRRLKVFEEAKRLRTDLVKTQAATQSLEMEKKLLIERLEQHQTEEEALSAQLCEAEARATALQRKVDDLDQEARLLRGQLEDAGNSRREDDAFAKLQEQHALWREQQTATTERQQNENLRLRREHDKLLRQLRSAQMQQKVKDEELAQASQQRLAAEAVQAARVEQLRGEVGDLQLQLEETKDARERLEAALEKERQQSAKFEAELRRVRSNQSALASPTEVASLKRRERELAGKVESLQKQLAMQKQSRGDDAELKELREVARSAQTQLEEERRSRSSLERQVQELERLRDDHNAELARLREEREKERSAAVAECEAQRREMAYELRIAETERRLLEEQLQKQANASSEISARREEELRRVAELEASFRALEHEHRMQNRHFEMQSREAAAWKARAEGVDEEVSQTRMALVEAEQRARLLEQQVSRLEEQLQVERRLQNEGLDASRILQETEQVEQQLLQQRREHAEEVARREQLLLQRVLAAEAKASQLASAFEASQQQLQQRQRELSRAEALRASAEAKCAAQASFLQNQSRLPREPEFGGATTALLRSNASAALLQTELASAREMLRAAEEARASLQLQLEEHLRQREAHASKARELLGELQTREVLFAEAEKERQSMMAQLEAYARDASKLQSLCRDFESLCEELSAQQRLRGLPLSLSREGLVRADAATLLATAKEFSRRLQHLCGGSVRLGAVDKALTLSALRGAGSVFEAGNAGESALESVLQRRCRELQQQLGLMEKELQRAQTELSLQRQEVRAWEDRFATRQSGADSAVEELVSQLRKEGSSLRARLRLAEQQRDEQAQNSAVASDEAQLLKAKLDALRRQSLQQQEALNSALKETEHTKAMLDLEHNRNSDLLDTLQRAETAREAERLSFQNHRQALDARFAELQEKLELRQGRREKELLALTQGKLEQTLAGAQAEAASAHSLLEEKTRALLTAEAQTRQLRQALEAVEKELAAATQAAAEREQRLELQLHDREIESRRAKSEAERAHFKALATLQSELEQKTRAFEAAEEARLELEAKLTQHQAMQQQLLAQHERLLREDEAANAEWLGVQVKTLSAAAARAQESRNKYMEIASTQQTEIAQLRVQLSECERELDEMRFAERRLIATCEAAFAEQKKQQTELAHLQRLCQDLQERASAELSRQTDLTATRAERAVQDVSSLRAASRALAQRLQKTEMHRHELEGILQNRMRRAETVGVSNSRSVDLALSRGAEVSRAQLEALSAQLSNARRENEELRRELLHWEAKALQRSGFQQRELAELLSETRREADRLRADLREARDAAALEEGRVEELSSRNEKSRLELRELQMLQAELREQLQLASHRANAETSARAMLEEEVDVLKTRLEEALAKTRETAQAEAEAGAELRLAKSKVGELESRVEETQQRLREETDRRALQIEQSEQLSQQLRRLTQSLAETEARLREAQTQVKEKTAAEEALAARVGQLESQQQELLRLQEEQRETRNLEQSQRALESAKTRQQVGELQALLQETERRAARLAAEAAESQQQLRMANQEAQHGAKLREHQRVLLDELREELRRTKEEAAVGASQLRRVSEQLSSAQSEERRLAELEVGFREELEEAHRVKEVALADLRIATQRMEDLRQQLTQQKELRRAAEQREAQKEALLEEVHSRVYETENSGASLAQSRNAWKEQCALLSQDLQRTSRELEEVREALDERNALLREAEAQTERQRLSLESLGAENKRLQESCARELKEQSLQVKSAMQQLREEQSRRSDAETEMRRFQEENAELRLQTEQQEQLREMLELRAKNAEQSAVFHQQQVAHLQRQCEQFEWHAREASLNQKNDASSIEQLKRENGELRAANAALQRESEAALEELRVGRDRQLAQGEALEQEQTEKQRLREQILEAENEATKLRTKAGEEAANHFREVAQLRRELELLQSERTNLEKLLEKHAASDEEARDSQARASSAEQEAALLREQLQMQLQTQHQTAERHAAQQREADELRVELQSAVDELRAKLEERHWECEALAESLERHKERLAQAEAQLEESKGEREKLLASHRALEQQHRELERRNSQVGSQLQEARVQLQNHEDALSDQRRSLGREAERLGAERSAAQLEGLEGEMQKQVRRLQELEAAQQQRLAELRLQNEEESKKQRRLQTEGAALRRQLESIRENIQAEQRRLLEAKAAQPDSRPFSTDFGNTEKSGSHFLREKLDEAHRSLRQRESELGLLKSRLDEEVQLCAELREQHKALSLRDEEKSRVIDDLQTQLREALQDGVEERAAREASASKQRAIVQELESALARREESEILLKRQVEQADRRVLQLQGELQTQAQRLRDAYDDAMKTQANALQRQMQQIGDAAEQHQVDVICLEKELQAQAKRIHSLQKENLALEKLKAEIEKRAAVASQQAAGAERMAQQLQALEKESRMRELEVADLRADVDCYRDDAELLRQHLALLHQRYVEDWQEAQAVFERSRSLAAHANPKQKLKLAELLSEQLKAEKQKSRSLGHQVLLLRSQVSKLRRADLLIPKENHPTTLPLPPAAGKRSGFFLYENKKGALKGEALNDHSVCAEGGGKSLTVSVLLEPFADSHLNFSRKSSRTAKGSNRLLELSYVFVMRTLFGLVALMTDVFGESQMASVMELVPRRSRKRKGLQTTTAGIHLHSLVATGVCSDLGNAETASPAGGGSSSRRPRVAFNESAGDLSVSQLEHPVDVPPPESLVSQVAFVKRKLRQKLLADDSRGGVSPTADGRRLPRETQSQRRFFRHSLSLSASPSPSERLSPSRRLDDLAFKNDESAGDKFRGSAIASSTLASALEEPGSELSIESVDEQTWNAARPPVPFLRSS